MKYGQIIEWNGGYVAVWGCDTQEEATWKCVDSARLSGWTNPKWWQFWRWGDTKLDEKALQSLNNPEVENETL